MLCMKRQSKTGCPFRRYAELESQHLRANLEAADVATASTEGAAESMQQLIPLAFQLCTATLDRCIRLTQGTELPNVVPLIDTALQDFLARLKVIIIWRMHCHPFPL